MEISNRYRPNLDEQGRLNICPVKSAHFDEVCFEHLKKKNKFDHSESGPFGFQSSIFRVLQTT